MEKLLEPLRAKVQSYNIVAFDSEDDSNGNVTLFDFYDGKHHFTFDLTAGKTLEDVVKFCYVYVPRRSIFVAHNLEYDINNMMRDLDYRFIDKMIYTSKLMTVTLERCQLLFIDSFNFFAGSLKKMGKIVGIEKGDYLEARESSEKNIEYIRSDTEILWSFVSQFQERANNDLGITLAPTIGKMSMDCFRANYLKNKFERFNHDLCRRGYYGGRVEVFYKGKIKGDVRVSDVNSMYPFVMLKRFPNTNDMRQGLNIDNAEFGIGEFKVKVPDGLHIPPLPYRADSGRLYFPTGEFTGVWTYHEIRNSMEQGTEILWQGECYGTNLGVDIFSEFINHFYDKRLKAKAINDDFLVMFYKLFMNNLYGKWSQNNPKYEVVREEVPANKLIKKGGKLIRKMGPFYMYEYTPQEPPPTSNWLWGTYVTSYARIHLHQGLNDIHNSGQLLCYCDTDSGIYKKENKKVPVELGNKLGQWDEEFFISGDFKNPKGYILEPENADLKIACKGVPTDYALEFFEQGSATFKKPIKLREGLVQDIKANVWREVEKQMRSVYIKREGEGKTRALNVSEIPEKELWLKKFIANTHKN